MVNVRVPAANDTCPSADLPEWSGSVASSVTPLQGSPPVVSSAASVVFAGPSDRPGPQASNAMPPSSAKRAARIGEEKPRRPVGSAVKVIVQIGNKAEKHPLPPLTLTGS